MIPKELANSAGSFFFAQKVQFAKKTGTIMRRKSEKFFQYFFPHERSIHVSKKESAFQKSLKDEIEIRFPGAVVQKFESYVQGWPDLLILHNDRWAMLECKRDANAEHQPNQDYYVDMLNKMSFAAFIFPENKEEVLNDLERAFKTRR